MKRVTKYQDHDGGLHDTPELCKQADIEILAKQQIFEIAQSIHVYNMTADELARELWDYRSSLQGALKDVKCNP